MTKLVIDPKTNKQAEDILGATGFISWGRLEKMFADAGEIHGNEQVLRFVVEEGGISYRVGSK